MSRKHNEKRDRTGRQRPGTTISGWAAGLVVMGAFFFAGCVKEDTPPTAHVEVTPAGKPTDVDPAQEKEAFRKPTLPTARNGENPEAIRLSPRPSAAPNPVPQRQLASEAGLLGYYPQQRLMPEDFKIGPLQDGISAARDHLKAVAAIRVFLDGIAKNKVDDGLMVPAAKAEIQSVISYPMSQGYVPQRYRIGKIAFEGDSEIRATLRLYKDEGATTGEIYLKKIDDGWLVSDLQAGFTLLARKYEKAKEPFTPGSYTFLLNDR